MVPVANRLDANTRLIILKVFAANIFSGAMPLPIISVVKDVLNRDKPQPSKNRPIRIDDIAVSN